MAKPCTKMCLYRAFPIILLFSLHLVKYAGGQSLAPQDSIFVAIISNTSSGETIVGQTYTLVCAVTGSTEPNITWVHNDRVITRSMSDATRMVLPTAMDSGGGSYLSNLTLKRVAASHTGTYMCTARINQGQSSNYKNASIEIIVRGS